MKFDKTNPHWGQVKGGLSSPGSTKQINVPHESEALAEFIGIVLGDGNIHAYNKGKNVGVYCVKLAGDYNKDKDYHLNYIKPLCENLFKLKANEVVRHDKKERFIALYSIELVKYLVRMGLKSGDKIKNQITIPKWIFNKNNFLKACLRGLIDTDGCIFRMSNQDPNLLRVGFKNHNRTLLEDARLAFVQLGFKPSKIINSNVFYLSSKGNVKKYIEEIGFSNSKHIQRLRNFRNSPVV